jgi:alkaline phosphatase
MVYTSAVDVILGAGHPQYDTDGDPVPGGSEDWAYVGGEATWNDLVAGTAGGDADGDGFPDPWTLVQTRQEFQDLGSGAAPPRLLGTAQIRTTLQQQRSGGPSANDPQPPYTVPLLTTVPTLEEMTRAALNVLDDDPDGLFLMIEGGAIDWAAHARQLGRTIEELNDFDDAFAAVVAWVDSTSDWSETLVIVTGDHETGFLWGPGSGPPDVFHAIEDNGAGNMPGYWYYSSSHTNSLIPLFACGNGSEDFASHAAFSDPVRGATVDNTSIAHVVFLLLASRTNVAAGDRLPASPRFEVGRVFPNPGHSSFTVPIRLTESGEIALELYDVAGRRLVEQRTTVPAGAHALPLEVRAVGRSGASGVYLLSVRNGGSREIRKVSVIR